MSSEVKSQHLDSRAQMIEREIRVHQLHCSELATKSDQFKQTIQRHKSDFEGLLRSMRSQPQLPVKAQALQARFFDHRARQLGNEIKHQRCQLEQIDHKRAQVAAIIHSRHNAVEKLNDRSERVKSSESIRREERDLDELVNIKAVSQQQESECPAQSVQSNSSTPTPATPHSPLKSGQQAGQETLINSERQQSQPLQLEHAWKTQHGDGVSLNYRSAAGHNFQLDFDPGAHGLTVRLKPQDPQARTEIGSRQAEIKRQLERSGVQVDRVICEE